MSKVEEIEEAITKLSDQDLARFRAWFEEYCEDRMKLKASVKAALRQSREEIRSGEYRMRQPR